MWSGRRDLNPRPSPWQRAWNRPGPSGEPGFMRFCPDFVQPVRPRPAPPYTAIPSDTMGTTALKLHPFAMNYCQRHHPGAKIPGPTLPQCGLDMAGPETTILSPTSASVAGVETGHDDRGTPAASGPIWMPGRRQSAPRHLRPTGRCWNEHTPGPRPGPADQTSMCGRTPAIAT